MPLSVSALSVHPRSSHVSKCILQIMSLLLPLRRMASGGTLSSADVAVPDLEEEAKKRSLAWRAAHGAGAGGSAGAGAGGAGGGSDDDDEDDDDMGIKAEKGGAAAAKGKGKLAPAAEPQQPRDAKPVVSAVAQAEQLCGLCGELVESPMRTGCGHWRAQRSMPLPLCSPRCVVCLS